MNAPKPFGLNLGALKAQATRQTEDKMAAVDRVGEAAGFVPRDPVPPAGMAASGTDGGRGRGRPPSPRTGQVHAKVLPEVAAEIAKLAAERGVTQGVLIEEAWAAYRRRG